jgi:hypothetical protein
MSIFEKSKTKKEVIQGWDRMLEEGHDVVADRRFVQQ